MFANRLLIALISELFNLLNINLKDELCIWNCYWIDYYNKICPLQTEKSGYQYHCLYSMYYVYVVVVLDVVPNALNKEKRKNKLSYEPMTWCWFETYAGVFLWNNILHVVIIITQSENNQLFLT